MAFSSGMAAFTACLLAAVAAGHREIVAVRPLYGGSDHLLATGLLGTSVRWAYPEEIETVIGPETGLVVVETPANPDLRLLDLAAVRRRAGGVPLLVDNTFATPVLQRPAEYGADLVLHSATKFLGGHGDVVAGVVACGNEWAQRLRPVRVHAAQQTAGKLADRLAAHPAVAAVHYPGLAECDPHGLVGRQMAGPGAILSFEVDGFEHAARVASACELITHAVSLGGVDTLIQHPASLTHRPVTADAKPVAGLLRVSVGLEDVEDLWEDLSAALAA